MVNMVGDGLRPDYSPATGTAHPCLYLLFRPVLGPIVCPNED